MAVKLKLAVLQVWISLLIVSISASYMEFPNCSCDDDGFWNLQTILECQKVSDFLIAVAYFSIPLELLYFLSCSNVPFKWVLLQFVAFIVLCGLTHLLNGWTYYGPHSFRLMMSLTVAKILTALVSCATAITLLTLIPLLLKIKVRELFLRQNVLELDQEVGMMKKQTEASMHVRMLTQEIRKSLDKHTILYTTLVELSKTLDLQNCAVWMLNENGVEMDLTYQLSATSAHQHHLSLPLNDPDVLEIIKNKGVTILRPESVLGAASFSGSTDTGAIAAIRMPMLRASNFKGGTPELIDTHYAILVLVLPSGNGRVWSFNEMQIVEVVADQVAVALSHAAVLEESQLMREKLEEQNRVLQQAKENAMMASQARDAFQRVMSNGMRRPLHSVLGLLAILQDDMKKKNPEQGTIVDTMLKTTNVLSTLINDAMEISAKDEGKFPLEVRPLRLHAMIRDASCLAKCLCGYKGFGFLADVPSFLPNDVMGDERRTFQVLLHMVGHLLNAADGKGFLTFRAVEDVGVQGRNDNLWGAKRASTSTGADEYVNLKLELEVCVESSSSTVHLAGRRKNYKEVQQDLSFSMCKKLVQMMQGNIWMSSHSEGRIHTMSLTLKFQKQSSFRRRMFDIGNSEQQISSSMFGGLRVILADDDDLNRMVTKKLLEKLGCQVTPVSSGFQCLSALGPSSTSFQVVILDLQMPEIDGFEVATRIRKYRSRNWPLIIALTASAEENVWERCLQVGINGLIRKPILLQGMADELRRVLQWSGEGM